MEKRRSNVISIFKDITPVECFEQLLDEDIIEDIVQHSVKYATQNNNHQFQLTNACMKKFIGILLFTGYHSLPQEQLYWCEDEDMDVQCVRKSMSRNRYLEIKQYLHLNDNSVLEKVSADDWDRLFKIRPLLEKLNKNFLKFGVFSENLSIDEKMVRCFGHHYLKQFMQRKPIRFEFKQWALFCSQTGYCYQMQVYEGKSLETGNEWAVTRLGASVVLQMVSILRHQVFTKFISIIFLLGSR